MNKQTYTQLFKFVIVFLCLFECATVATSQNAEMRQNSESFNSIEIKIETSRPKPEAGTGIGFMAEIKNLSQSQIYLKEKNITLSLPPELDPCVTATGWYGFFPTETDSAGDNFKNALWLMPGEAYKVFWNRKPCEKESQKKDTPPFGSLSYILNTIQKMLDEIDRERKFIFFSPGDYKITIAAKYLITDSTGTNFHFATQTTTLPVATPQSVILFGAAIGGLIAYFLLPQARRKLMKPTQQASSLVSTIKRFAKENTDNSRSGLQVTAFLISAIERLFIEGAGILGSVLLSAIITILLSRISETQFLIRITVADFWGAIAIGFVANYFGAKFFDKIIGSATPNHQETPAKSEEGGSKTNEPRKDDVGYST